jgi:predicted metal-binding membrane protein
MRSVVSGTRIAPAHVRGLAVAGSTGWSSVLPLAIGAAWLIALVGQLTGQGALLHHDALIEGGRPPWLAVALFLLGWQVMIAAMMLPASLPSIGVFDAGLARLARPGRALAAFLGSYALLWSVFGLVAFLGDVVLHRIVDASPWLAARSWLIEAGVIGLAGAYQLVPLKRRSLRGCRHPGGLVPTTKSPQRSSFQSGLDHGLACLGSSWALMLLMFAEGFANLGWMVALAAVMAYETTGRHGQRAAGAVGVLLLLFGAVVLSTRGAI